MSLFKTRDWWSVTVGEDEEFGHGCLCTANVDNDASGCGEVLDRQLVCICLFVDSHMSVCR